MNTYSNISYIGTLFNVRCIQDSGLFRVRFRQDSLYYVSCRKDCPTRSPKKNVSEPRCCGRINSYCSTSGRCRVNFVTNPVISHNRIRDIFQNIYRGRCDRDRMAVTEILLKVALNTITLTQLFTKYLMITSGKRFYYIINE